MLCVTKLNNHERNANIHVCILGNSNILIVFKPVFLLPADFFFQNIHFIEISY